MKTKLNYPIWILNKLTSEQVARLEKGAKLRRCTRCGCFFTCEGDNVVAKCPFCNKLEGEKKVKRVDIEDFKKAGLKNMPLKYR